MTQKTFKELAIKNRQHYLVYVCEHCGWPERIWLTGRQSISEFPWTKQDICLHCSSFRTLYRAGVYQIPSTQERMPEFLYIFYAANGLYKIGRSKDPAQRLQAFRAGPVEVALIWQKEFRDVAEAERNAHHYFRDRRVRGEWFDLAPEQVEAFIAINALEG